MSELLTSCALPHPLTDALPSSALLLTQVMDQLPYRVLLKDTRFSYIAGNRLLAADLALSPEALVGKNDCDFFPPELVQPIGRMTPESCARGYTSTSKSPI